MDESREKESLHVAMLPWLAFGHMIPFLQLAVVLANAGVRVSFVSTPRNTRRLLPKVPNHLSFLIRFVDFPLPPVKGLPEQAEATADVVSLDQSQYLKIAHDSLREPIKRFIENESPDCILHDFSPYWATDIGRECSVRCIFFSVYSASTLTFLGPPEAMTEAGRKRCLPTAKPEWVPFPSAVAFRPKEAEGFYRGAFKANASGISDMDRFRLAIEGCSAVAVRSCEEYEGEHLELLERLYQKPVIPIGLLPPEVPPPEKSKDDQGWRRILDWLDSQKPKSVVFVSFGSECKLSENKVHEIAHGLEISNVPFLWALRRPAWVTAGGQDEEALPKGFIGRTTGRGIVSFGWAPQLEILAHPSIGGSFFHSGWGSVIETLRYGHTLVVLPSIYDQGLNARHLVEKGLAIEVEKDEDGSFNRNMIADSLTKAMMVCDDEVVKEMRVKAREMGAIFADQALHDQYVKTFLDFLVKSKE